MLTIHHLENSRSQRILRLLEELGRGWWDVISGTGQLQGRANRYAQFKLVLILFNLLRKRGKQFIGRCHNHFQVVTKIGEGTLCWKVNGLWVKKVCM